MLRGIEKSSLLSLTELGRLSNLDRDYRHSEVSSVQAESAIAEAETADRELAAGHAGPSFTK
jgi:hypothetical protein